MNRSSAQVALGVGVRAVRGDQQGHGFTEDHSLPAILSGTLLTLWKGLVAEAGV